MPRKPSATKPKTPRKKPSAEERPHDEETGSEEAEETTEDASDGEPDGEPEGEVEDGGVDSGPIPPIEKAAKSDGAITRFDPFAAYMREVQRHPVMTAEQTHELAAKFVQTQDPALAAQLVTANLRLVVKIAYEYRRAYKNIMDLIQEGNIGLMQAVKRYDPYRGVKLSSYAAWWIRAYILRFILNNWRLVKLGTTQAQRKLFSIFERSARSFKRWASIPPTKRSRSA